MSANTAEIYPELAKDQPIYYTQPLGPTALYMSNEMGVVKPVE